MQEPMRPTLISTGQSFFLATSPSLEMGFARSGVNGPLTWGSRVERSISINWEKKNNFTLTIFIYSRVGRGNLVSRLRNPNHCESIGGTERSAFYL